MEIRKMKQENIDIYTNIYQDVFKKEPWLIDEEDELVKAYLLKFFQLNNCLAYEISLGSGPIGFILGTKKPWIDGYEYYIDQFCIETREQKKGYGSLALDLLEESLYQEEVTCISLITDRDTRSYDFYRANNFTSLREYSILTKEI